MAHIHTHATACAAQVKPGGGFAQAMTAGRDARAAVHALGLAATGENLDHAADGIGTIQRRARAAHDFDMVDLRQRNILQRGQARGGRTHAHAVDQK